MNERSWTRSRGSLFVNKKPVPPINSGQALSEVKGSKTCATFDKLGLRACRGEPRRSKQRRKWAGLFAIVVKLTLCVAVTEAQPKIPKIGYLAASSALASGGLELFRPEFRKLGYVEGKNIAFESRFAENKYDRLPALADELVRLKVDVIITPGANDTRAAKNATKTIPIVFLSTVSDPVSLGLVDSLARPGGNITGFTTIGSVLTGKRLELLKETIPKLSRVAVLWDPQNSGSAQIWKESQLPARELGLQLHSLEVNSADKFESGFRQAAKARSAAVTVTGGSLIAANHTDHKPGSKESTADDLPSGKGGR